MNCKHFIACAVLAAASATSATSATSAESSPQAWNFVFPNLCGSYTGCFDFKGSFAGDDVNRDGIISLSELRWLQADGSPYYPAYSEVGGFNVRWNTESFSYTIGGPLNFISRSSGYRFVMYIDTRDRYVVEGPNFLHEGTSYFLGPGVVTPVPEPSTFMLALAAMAGLLSWHRFKRPPARPRLQCTSLK